MKDLYVLGDTSGINDGKYYSLGLFTREQLHDIITEYLWNYLGYGQCNFEYRTDGDTIFLSCEYIDETLKIYKMKIF